MCIIYYNIFLLIIIQSGVSLTNIFKKLTGHLDTFYGSYIIENLHCMTKANIGP